MPSLVFDIRPGAISYYYHRQADKRSHRQDDKRNGHTGADPQTAREILEFRAGFVTHTACGFQRHAAKRAVRRSVRNDLRVHRTRIAGIMFRHIYEDDGVP